MQLAPGFTAHQLRRQQGSSDTSSAWEAVASSDAITYWNHDTTPCSTDAARRCLDWLPLAAAVSPSGQTLTHLGSCSGGLATLILLP